MKCHVLSTLLIPLIVGVLALGVKMACQADMATHLEQAVELYNAGQYDSAIEKFQVLASTTTDVAAHSRLYLGLCYQKVEKYAQAISVLKRAVELAPVGDEAYLRDVKRTLASAYQSKGDLAKAAAVYEAYIKEYPDDQARAQFQLGRYCYLYQKKYPEAIAAIETAIGLAPKDDTKFTKEARSSLAWTYKLNGDYDSAVSAYQAYIQDYPDAAAQAYFDLGRHCYPEQNKYREAIAALEKAIELAPKDDAKFIKEARSSLAWTYKLNGDYDSAVSAYLSYIQDFPDAAVQAYFDLGRHCYPEQKKYPDAIAAIEKAIELAPKDDGKFIKDARASLAWTYKLNGDYESAVSTYMAYIQDYPDAAAQAYFDLGRHCYPEQKKYPEAIAALKKAIELAPKDDGKFIKEARSSLAWTYKLNGDYESAVSTYLSYIEDYPNAAAQAYFDLGRYCYPEQNRYRDAIAALEKAIELAPKDDTQFIKDARSSLAWTYKLNGDYDSAVSTYLSYIEDFPDAAAQAYFDLGGYCYPEQKKYREAIAALEKAIELATKPRYKQILKDMRGRLAACYKELGEWDKAISVYLILKQEYPEGDPLWDFEIGECYRVGEYDPEAAAVAYQDIIRNAYELIPTLTEEGLHQVFVAYRHLGTWSQKAKYYTDGSIFFQEIIKQRPDLRVAALFWQAELVFLAKDYWKAHLLVNKYREECTDTKSVFYKLANSMLVQSLIGLGRTEHALVIAREIEENLDSKKEKIEFCRQHADLFFRKQDYVTAVDEYTHLAKLGGSCYDEGYALYQRAICQQRLGKTNEAAKSLSLLVRRCPNGRYTARMAFISELFQIREGGE